MPTADTAHGARARMACVTWVGGRPAQDTHEAALSSHNQALLRVLRASVGTAYTLTATHVLQNSHVRTAHDVVAPSAHGH